ncbi:transcription factor bHLH70-like [Pistacia vera]|uniref:transcription factor bHLH70-like n=1 Tax=Pistacia vera TaxID=55513 RepID=UPI00126362F0|nr:transcription factor bHLH70-like [Pistacia vera]
MPFLQMLQSVETPSLFPFKEPNFQTLLRLQHLKKPWDVINPYVSEMENQIQVLELESCITQEILDLHSPVKSQSETKDLQNPHSTSCLEGASSESNQDQPNSVEITHPNPQTRPKHTQFSKSLPVTRERRKRKRTKPTKNKEEVESQRMTHIAVERNRRRQMNDHLNALRSLMPPSYVQRGDQASIIGGAIDFVKELEQLLLSLEAQKRMRMEKTTVEGYDSTTSSSSTDKANGLLAVRPQIENCDGEVKGENKSSGAKIEVIVIQNHVNLKIQCPRRPGQLLKAIVALEDLRLTFLHLNITSSQTTVHYSFNLKIEDECKIGSADEIVAAVHQIFSYINAS